MDQRRRNFLGQIRRAGVDLTPELAAVFAAVPREAFVPEGFRRRDGTWAQTGDRDFTRLVYQDDVLVTKIEGTLPVSASSQPSLMAIMIGALDVRPGMRVLEIGAGTGYNAALLAALGAVVTSIDVQEDVADRARQALTQAGISGVRVLHGDGYEGLPGEQFDRMIVTVGIAGLSARWIEQLADNGLVVAPIDHAGTHPILATVKEGLTTAREGLATGPELTATVVCPSGFMVASGPLTAPHPGAHPAPAGPLKDLHDYAPARFEESLTRPAYRDLWYAAGVWSRRASYANIPAKAVQGRDHAALVLLDESRTGGAVVLPDGRVLTAGPDNERAGAEAVSILDRWIAAGRPSMQAWQVGFTLTGDPGAPIWVPADWRLH